VSGGGGNTSVPGGDIYASGVGGSTSVPGKIHKKIICDTHST